MPKSKLTLEQRIFQKVVVDPNTGCWNFCGARLPDGYGQISIGNRKVARVHRVTYEMLKGPIPEGHVLHHTCRNPPCCNPAHLEPTSQRAHVLELSPDSIASKNARKVTCRKGHPLTPDNLEEWFLQRGVRKCSRCAREREREYAKRNPEKRREACRLAQQRLRARRKGIIF